MTDEQDAAQLKLFDFLTKLGVRSAISASIAFSFDAMSRRIASNYGQPDMLIMSPQAYEAYSLALDVISQSDPDTEEPQQSE